MTNILCCVVALPVEAKPLISFWGMTKYPKSDCFPTYRTYDERRWVVISGIGKLASATALGYLAHLADASRSTSWLNWGIAGSKEYTVGQSLIGHKITDVSLKKSWYPSQIFQGPRLKLCPTAHIQTYDSATEEYPDKGVVDMESSGFCAGAMRFSTIELVQSVKVVSDTPTEPISQITKSKVTELMTSNLATIDEIASQLLVLGKEISDTEVPPSKYQQFCSQWHFSVTQAKQLKRLLVQWSVLLPDVDVRKVVEASNSARDVLCRLRKKLNKVRVKFGVKDL